MLPAPDEPALRLALRNTIGDALRRSARKHRDRIALYFGDRHWTYAGLDAAVTRLARALLAMGLEPGDRVAALGRNSDIYVLLFLACARAGFIHVPVNFMLTGRELLYILNQSGSRAVFYDAQLEPAVAAVRDQAAATLFATMESLLETVLPAGPGAEGSGAAPGAGSAAGAGGAPDSAAGAASGDAAFAAVDEDQVVQLLYTSGTTAAPKGAMMTHRALLAEYLSCIVELDIQHHDRCLHALPLYHSAQMHVFLMPQLLVGATGWILPAPVPEVCLPLIARQRINSMFAPPTVWINFLRHPEFDRHDLSSLKKVYYGASIMPVPVLQELRQRLPGVAVYNCYGQSEIAPLATVLRPEEHDARPASAGRPVLHVETRVVDPDMRDVPPGQLGEIVHRSPQLLVGYWEKPEETAEAFQGGWFHSGDLGYMDEEGYLYVVDRIKDVINTGGVLVASREVEEVLYTHPAVSEVAVIALPDPRWIEAVTAVVVLKRGATATADDLIAHARQHLAPFKVPKRVIFVDDLPRNASGKILKRELRARFAAGTG
ncbi:acyl-CoA synthetase [Thermaerobacter sp. PB12/4term]|uniref:acyl-CoA synthetase n=1 Tax=Thermaerobacter sp. PB12/4term TaxID=2293838 RepID=UPI000E32A2C4|nr:acyl-CoA synthetase [Thermaerobacter sp. PB12/4term]QIA26423.1 acyl-CoA synthetase [Thermaerobacter sp. PB12/4term]